jgi:transcriptional regulator with XRE-family HTH domain
MRYEKAFMISNSSYFIFGENKGITKNKRQSPPFHAPRTRDTKPNCGEDKKMDDVKVKSTFKHVELNPPFFTSKTMESPGKYLKAEREHRNLSLEEVVKSTKIRKTFLSAIEEDRYELFPPAIYVKGFLNTYAKYLGLDPKDVIFQSQNNLRSLIVSESPELQQQITFQKKRVRLWPFFIIIFAITLLIAFIVYNISKKLSESPPSVDKKSIIPLPLPSQEKAEIQLPDQAKQREILNQEEKEAKNAILTKTYPFEVLEGGVGTGIETEGGRLILIGKCSEFIAHNQRAYFFTRIKSQSGGKLAHVWIWEGKEFHRIEMEVRPPTWSVSSYLTLRSHLLGNWKAEVRDGNKILSSINFKVIKSINHINQN